MLKLRKLFAASAVGIAGLLSACSEYMPENQDVVDFPKVNKRMTDSISALESVIVTSMSDVASLQPGKMFKIIDRSLSTNKDNQHYIYCKKLIANTNEGQTPYSNSTVRVYYCGTLANGFKFDSNFEGYAARDIIDYDNIKLIDKKQANSTTFDVDKVISGWTEVLPYFKEGERWMIYIPMESAYGPSGTGKIPGGAMLAFDIQLEEVINAQ